MAERCCCRSIGQTEVFLLLFRMCLVRMRLAQQAGLMCATIIPWNMYLAYGDKKILEQQYPSMKAWVELYEKQK